MPELPRHLRLTGGDYFMHGQDHAMRQAGLPGNICRVSLRLAQGLNVARLRQHIAASPLVDWLTRARVVRPLPLLAPVWRREPDPTPALYEHTVKPGEGQGPGNLPPAVLERDLLPTRGPGLVLDLVHSADGTAQLVLSWNHTIMDARGAEFLLRHLSTDGAAPGAPTLQDLLNPEQRGWSLAEWWRKAKFARGSIRWLHESGRDPLFSLLPGQAPAQPCQNPCRLLRFTAQETARLDDRCEALNASFRRSHFYLAAALWALHRIAARRGNQDGAYLVPVPHDMRRHGACGPIFSNQLSVFFYRVEARVAARLNDTIGELTRQMTDQIRDRIPQSCMAALDLFKPMPLDFYVRHLGGPSQGKFATMCFSDVGETCRGVKEIMGGRILEATHLVPTWRPPGLTVLFWRFRDQQRILLSCVDDCLNRAEAEALEADLRAALLEDTVL